MSSMPFQPLLSRFVFLPLAAFALINNFCGKKSSKAVEDERRGLGTGEKQNYHIDYPQF